MCALQRKSREILLSPASQENWEPVLCPSRFAATCRDIQSWVFPVSPPVSVRSRMEHHGTAGIVPVLGPAARPRC